MKIKLTVLICTAVLLVGLLAGCGTETAEPVAEAETQPVVATESAEATTEPTEVTTEPTEPPTLFEELGIELWGGQTPSTDLDYWVYDVPAKTTGLWHVRMGIPYVSRSGADYTNIVTSKITEADTSIEIKEVPKEWMIGGNAYEGEPYKSLLTEFYDIYKSRETQPLSKEEWFDQKRFLSVSVNQDILTAKCIKEDEALGSPMPSFQVGMLTIVDMNTGMEIIPTPCNDGGVGVFTVKGDGEANEIMVSWESEVRFLENMNGTHSQRLYVLVPREYDGMVFSYVDFIKPFTQETFTAAIEKTYEEPWTVSNIADKPDEIDKLCKKIYFNFMSPEEFFVEN